MDLKDSLVKGSVLVVHQIHEGKHCYEVENVIKYKKASGEKTFVRGDKLMQINDMDLQDLTPDEFAQKLAEGNPKLTVHKTGSRMKTRIVKQPPTEDTLYPVSKESTILSFSMEMRREENLEKNEVGQEGEGREDGHLEEDVCQPENEENGKGRDLLIISMMKTSISMMTGRGCDAGSPCQGCHGTGCSFNDIVVVAESSTVTLVPRGGESFRQIKLLNTSIKHVFSHQYLRGLCQQKTVYASPNPEKITIYSYKSNTMDTSFRGIPVVLNLTESNCFLRCCKEGERVFLQVETCEKQRLKQISMSDQSTLSFVFYMKADPTKHFTFESVLHHNWYIQIVNTDSVELGTMDGGKENEAFIFIIQKYF